VQWSDIEIRWNPIFIISRLAAYRSAASYCRRDKVGATFGYAARLPEFFAFRYVIGFPSAVIYTLNNRVPPSTRVALQKLRLWPFIVSIMEIQPRGFLVFSRRSLDVRSTF